MVKILQLNADGARRVAAELRMNGRCENADILALQAPYLAGGRVAGYGCRGRIVTGERDREKVWAAIVVLNDRVGVCLLYTSDFVGKIYVL